MATAKEKEQPTTGALVFSDSPSKCARVRAAARTWIFPEPKGFKDSLRVS
jgi:hypothetical protein